MGVSARWVCENERTTNNAEKTCAGAGIVRYYCCLVLLFLSDLQPTTRGAPTTEAK